MQCSSVHERDIFSLEPLYEVWGSSKEPLFFAGLISELGMSSKMSWEFENGFLDNSIYIFCSYLMSKPVTYVASNLLANDSQLDVRIAFNDLQQKIKQVEYFTCDPLITQPIVYL